MSELDDLLSQLAAIDREAIAKSAGVSADRLRVILVEAEGARSPLKARLAQIRMAAGR